MWLKGSMPMAIDDLWQSSYVHCPLHAYSVVSSDCYVCIEWIVDLAKPSGNAFWCLNSHTKTQK